MKICKKCGAVQNDSRTVCIDCGEALPAPVSDEERESIEAELSEKIDDKVENAELSYVGPFAKCLAAVDILGIAASFIIISIFNERPKIGFALYSILFFIAGAVITLFPLLEWKLDMFRLNMRYGINTDDLTPPHSRLISNRIFRTALPIIAIFLLLCAVFG